MSFFPFLFSFVAAVVNAVGVSFVMNWYRGRYESGEMRAALAVGVATFLFFITMFYGEQMLSGKTGEEIVGFVMIVIVLLAAIIVYRSLRRGKPSV